MLGSVGSQEKTIIVRMDEQPLNLLRIKGTYLFKGILDSQLTWHRARKHVKRDGKCHKQTTPFIDLGGGSTRTPALPRRDAAGNGPHAGKQEIRPAAVQRRKRELPYKNANPQG